MWIRWKVWRVLSDERVYATLFLLGGLAGLSRWEARPSGWLGTVFYVFCSLALFGMALDLFFVTWNPFDALPVVVGLGWGLPTALHHLAQLLPAGWRAILGVVGHLLTALAESPYAAVAAASVLCGIASLAMWLGRALRSRRERPDASAR